MNTGSHVWQRWKRNHREEYLHMRKEEYGTNHILCPHARMFSGFGMKCPWFVWCCREDRGKYYECKEN